VDIRFDPTKPPASVHGFVERQFFAAFADGSVHTIENDKVKDQLVWMILRNDRHPILWEKIVQPQRGAEMQRRENVESAGRVADIEPGTGGRRAVQDENNLKMLGLAMYSYHDVNQHFPQSVVIGPDGKTPHSWRVELLPLLNAAALYQQYRMNEPWDSPANKQVLEQMPGVFRSPYDDPKSTNSGYYVFAGPDTAAGARIRDINDGTSNTLLIVATKRSIPWTKPEDIPFDPAQPAPTLGGFVRGEFAAVMCDGSAHRFNIDRVQNQLKSLIIRNDGNTIPIEVLQGTGN
jgi:hypothetical protein